MRSSRHKTSRINYQIGDTLSRHGQHPKLQQQSLDLSNAGVRLLHQYSTSYQASTANDELGVCAPCGLSCGLHRSIPCIAALLARVSALIAQFKGAFRRESTREERAGVFAR